MVHFHGTQMGVHQRGLGLAYANEILGNVGSGVWMATMVYCYGISPWNTTMVYYHGILPWYMIEGNLVGVRTSISK